MKKILAAAVIYLALVAAGFSEVSAQVHSGTTGGAAFSEPDNGIVVVNDENFGEVLASGRLVMIDFWASWCNPCMALAPTIEEIAAEYKGRAVIGKCNVDESSDTPKQYNIRNIPTLLFFRDGKLADKIVGAVPKSEITAKLDSFLKKLK